MADPHPSPPNSSPAVNKNGGGATNRGDPNTAAAAAVPPPPPSPPPLEIAGDILRSDWANVRSSRSLRVTCYGSSSSATPSLYLQEALHAGYVLARRGHVCVNGAGSYGCMAALNDGAHLGNGHIVGVIHEMWLVDNHGEDAAASSAAASSSSSSSTPKNNQTPAQWEAPRNLRDGGAHGVFSSLSSPSSATSSSFAANGDDGAPRQPIREMLVAGGRDLQERKRLLVDGSDALLVLPGGPGTWDELWEMACARNIGLTTMPIVCVNPNGYYDPFRTMLERAHRDQLTKLTPDDILHFADTAEEAIRWIEESVGRLSKVTLHKRASALRSNSVLSVPEVGDATSWFTETIRRAASWVGDTASKHPSSSHRADDDTAFSDGKRRGLPILQGFAVFGTGVAVGVLLASRLRR